MRTIIVLITMFISSSIFSQDGLEAYLKAVEINNKELISARSLLDAQKYFNRIGNNPSNPEVEYGYLPGSEKSMGYKSIYEINQSFSFPTVYTIKSKISKKESEINDFEYQIIRQDILLNAKRKYIEFNSLLRKETEYKLRVDRAEKLLNEYNSKIEKDSANIIDVNKVNIMLLNIKSDYLLLLQDIENVKKELKLIAGGVSIERSDMGIVIYEDLVLDSIISQIKTHHLKIKYLNTKLEHAQMNTKLSFRKSLPEFTIGYQVETEQEGTYQGIKAGMTIPLWENDNAVKYSETNELYISNLYESEVYCVVSEVEGLYNKAITYQDILKEYKMKIDFNNCISIIEKAYTSGELSSVDYYNELTDYYDIINRKSEIEKEYLLLLAELYSYKL